MTLWEKMDVCKNKRAALKKNVRTRSLPVSFPFFRSASLPFLSSDMLTGLFVEGQLADGSSAKLSYWSVSPQVRLAPVTVVAEHSGQLRDVSSCHRHKAEGWSRISCFIHTNLT